jgi:hypothetical protein
MNPTHYYKLATLYPAVASVISAGVYAVIKDWNYKSEWLSAEASVFISIISAVLYSMIMAVLSLTIYLNRIEVVRRSLLLSFLSWFLLPAGFILKSILHEYLFNAKYGTTELMDNLLPVVIITLPFLVALFLSYYKCRRRIRLDANPESL